MDYPVLSSLEEIHDVLGEAKASLAAQADSALQVLSPLFASGTFELNPKLPILIEEAAVLNDCPLYLHLVLNAPEQERVAAKTIQQFGDQIGDVRMRVEHPCRIVVATIVGGCHAGFADGGWTLDDQAQSAIEGKGPKAATSTVATLESYYTQGFFDRDIPPTSLYVRGLKPQDRFVQFGE